MTCSSYDLLVYINNHKGNLNIPSNPQKELGISQMDFDSFVDELSSYGYIKRYMRSYGITPEGKEYLNNN